MSFIHRRPLEALVWLFLLALSTPCTVSAGFTQTYQATGHLHLEVTGAAGLNQPAMGTLTLATLPAGTIQRAYLYATQVNNTAGLSGSFAGAPLPIAPVYASDALLITLSTYRWDVTSRIIPGIGSYGFTLVDAMGAPVPIAGVGLAVVWQDPVTQPSRMVTIVDGVQQVGENGAETETMTFTGLSAGSTTLWVFTTDDDASLGETIRYNSTNVGGPLVGNLGLNASVLKMTGTSVSGTNQLSISTLTDHLTWVLGAAAVDLPTVGVSRSTWAGVKSLFQ